MASNNVNNDADVEQSDRDGTLCFICENGESEERLTFVGLKGKNSLAKMCAESGGDELLEKLNAQWINETLACHKSCKLGVYNSARTGNQNQINQEQSEREEARRKKQRTSHGRGESVFLPYKNKCILCNKLVSLYTKNPEIARKTYSRPDSLTAPELKKRLLQTADERLASNTGDQWAVEVKGRLLGITDFVAAETLLHKRCNTNFFSGRGNDADGDSGRKIDADRQNLFDTLCTILDEEMEQHLFTLEEIHQKMVDLDETEEKSQAYTKWHLKTK